MTASGERLIAEALAKSGIIWLTSPSGTGPVWYVALNDVAYVVTGPGEQTCPIHEGTTTVVTRSKETRARLLTYEADADILNPEAEDWDAALAALIAGRLNAPAGDIEARWRENNTILRFTPDTSSVIVRGEHVTAHERQVEIVEPEISEVTDVAETPSVAESEATPTVSEQTTAPSAVPPSQAKPHRDEPEQKPVAPKPPTVRAADTQPIPVRPRKTAARPAATDIAAPVTRPVSAPSPEHSSRKSSSPHKTGDHAPSLNSTPAKPASETTQPIPVRPRQRNTEQTQPIPVRAPSRPASHEPVQREITEPIPVRKRNRAAAPTRQSDTDDVARADDVAKVDQ